MGPVTNVQPFNCFGPAHIELTDCCIISEKIISAILHPFRYALSLQIMTKDTKSRSGATRNNMGIARAPLELSFKEIGFSRIQSFPRHRCDLSAEIGRAHV